MSRTDDWSSRGGTDATLLRRLMSRFSLFVREKQFAWFEQNVSFTANESVLDVGISTDESLPDTNFFEKRYPYPGNITIASVEDCKHLVHRYNVKSFVQISEKSPLPFADESFDIVVSWATVEHAGSRDQQEYFLRELLRVGKKVFVTTPDRLSIYEPHTTVFFLHYLPQRWFRAIAKKMGKHFWAQEKHLNILSFYDLRRMLYNTPITVERFKLFGIIPSHIIMYGKTRK